MTSSSPAPSVAVPSALPAFLRGIERRGAVLAQLQSGSAESGDVALTAAMRAFVALAPGLVLAQWPQRFWSLLLATPHLRRVTALAGETDAELVWLGRLDPGTRAALLLRLVAGLSEAEAAEVLAVALPDYRRMLHRALPRHEDGRADAATWQRLRDQLHRRIKTLPDKRLAQLARLRDTALGEVSGRSAAGHDARRQPPRRLLAVLWTLLSMCGLALATSYAWPYLDGWWQAYRDPSVIRREALPAVSPAARFDAETALLSHRDFELLADQQGLAASDDLAFFSWMAAQPASTGEDVEEDANASH